MSAVKNNAPSDDSYVEVSTASSQTSSNGNANGTLLRALTIASTSGVEVQIPVPSQPFDAWIVADVLREEFQRSLAAAPEVTDVLEVQEEQEDAGAADKAAGEAKVSLAAKFLGFLASRATVKSSSHELNLLHSTWIHFHDHFVAQRGSVHDLVAALDTDLRTSVLRSYFEAFAQLESAGKAKPALITPKLFSLSAQNKAEVHAVFGGQGNNEVSSFPTIHSFSFSRRRSVSSRDPSPSSTWSVAAFIFFLNGSVRWPMRKSRLLAAVSGTGRVAFGCGRISSTPSLARLFPKCWGQRHAPSAAAASFPMTLNFAVSKSFLSAQSLPVFDPVELGESGLDSEKKRERERAQRNRFG